MAGEASFSLVFLQGSQTVLQRSDYPPRNAVKIAVIIQRLPVSLTHRASLRLTKCSSHLHVFFMTAPCHRSISRTPQLLIVAVSRTSACFLRHHQTLGFRTGTVHDTGTLIFTEFSLILVWRCEVHVNELKHLLAPTLWFTHELQAKAANSSYRDTVHLIGLLKLRNVTSCGGQLISSVVGRRGDELQPSIIATRSITVQSPEPQEQEQHSLLRPSE